MKIKLVVCDLAGTTIRDNQDVHKALQKAMLEFGIPISLEEANDVMGIPKPLAIRQLLNTRLPQQEINDSFIDRIHEKFVLEMTRFYAQDPAFSEKEGVSETFLKLKLNGIKVVVDTGFDRKITNVILERTGWVANGLIDGSVTSDEVAKGRPHPDLIFKAMELAGVAHAGQVAKVGDTSSDLQEGTSAGCGLVVGVTTGAFPKEKLMLEKHTHLIQEIPELAELLGLT